MWVENDWRMGNGGDEVFRALVGDEDEWICETDGNDVGGERVDDEWMEFPLS